MPRQNEIGNEIRQLGQTRSGLWRAKIAGSHRRMFHLLGVIGGMPATSAIPFPNEINQYTKRCILMKDGVPRGTATLFDEEEHTGVAALFLCNVHDLAAGV